MPTEPDMRDVAAALDAIEAELRKIDALTNGSNPLVALATGACKAAKHIADHSAVELVESRFCPSSAGNGSASRQRRRV